MADVFLARQLGPAGFEKECVIKRILPHLSQDPNNHSFIEMFLDEARIAARLSHPNIVHMLDLGQQDGDYFLALEYIDGLTVESILERVKQAGQPGLPWPIAVRIVSNVAEGLDHAHKAKDSAGNHLQLVHRDISPSNIIVSWDGVSKVLDFGIAKAMNASGVEKVKTGVGIIKGKIPYMSPEQIQGFDLDGRSDIFSLAAILYEMTTGQRPFPGDTTGQLTVQITSREPRSPDTINPGFPHDLWPVLLRALAKAVDKRYQSARDFKLDLEQFLSDQHVSCTNYDVEAYLRELVPDRPRPVLPSAEEIARVEAEAHAAEAVSASTGTPPSGSGPNAYRREPTPPMGIAPPSLSASSLPEVQDAGADGPSASGRRGSEPSSGHAMDVLEAENAAEQRRQRESSGGVIMGAIALLVIVTAVIFYFLHERALQQSGEGDGSGQTAQPVPPTAVPPTAVPPTPVPPAATPTPPAVPTATGAPAANPATAAKPAATEPEKKPAEKPAATAATPTGDADKPKPAAGSEETPAPKPKAHRPKKHEDDGPKGSPSNLPLPPPPPVDPE